MGKPAHRKWLPQVAAALLLVVAVLSLFLATRTSAAVYALPGTCDTALGTYPIGDPRNGLHLVARDSNGYWYVVWENASQSDILMAYSTTSTPLNAGGWALVTLVDNAAGGVITAAPANDTSGSYPSICIGLDDVLHFVWRAADTTGTCYYTQCSDLSALSTASNWTTPLRVSTDITDYSFALDYNGAPHLAGRGKNSLYVLYTKYDTGSSAWLAEKALSTQVTTYNTAAPDSMALAVDLDNNVFVGWRGTRAAAPTVTSTFYLLASSNADSVASTASSWLNLGQSSTTPDAVKTNASAQAPLLLANMGGFFNMAGSTGFNAAANAYWMSPEQLLEVGLLAGNQTVNAPILFSLGQACPGYGYSMLLVSDNNGGVGMITMPSTVSNLTNANWRTRNSGISGIQTIETSVSAQGFLSPARLPRDMDSNLWFAYNTTNQKIVTTDSALSTSRGGRGWAPPSQSKRLPHPHLKWVSPSGRVGVSSTPAPAVPIVAHTSKSAVYLVNHDTGGAPTLWAIDSTTGIFARSYTVVRPVQLAAATYSGNVHLFVTATSCVLQTLIDNGASFSQDAGWATNPLSVGNITGAVLHSLAFNSESGVRYLYMLTSVDPVNIGINKINADTGAVAAGFNAGIAYSPNATNLQSLLRVVNDNVYVAGNTSQVYRRGSDGSAEIFSSGITNTVRRLMLWRNSNDLYVSPDGNYVYRLTSGLLTNTWISGQSASPGTVKTAGAQMNPERTFLFMGVGNQLYKINVTDGSLISNTPYTTTGNIVTAPYQWKTFVYFGTDVGMIYAVNASDPTVARANWPINVSTPFGGSGTAASVNSMVIDAANNTIYVVTSGSTNRRIFSFRLE